MVVRDFYFVSVRGAPFEANSVLIVDSYAVLTLAIAAQLRQPVPGWDPQIVQRQSAIEHGQLASRRTGWRRTPSLAGSPDFRRLFVGESPDHKTIITMYINNVNR